MVAKRQSPLAAYKGVLVLAILAVVLGYAQYTGFDAARWIKDKMLSWKDQIQSMGLAGALVVMLVDIAFIVCVFPGSWFLELYSGYVFGVLGGVAVILAAKNIAAVICFFIGRTVAADTCKRLLKNNKHFKALQKTNQSSGWQLVLAMRLSPMPSYVVSYGSSILNVPFASYMRATLVASAPFVVQNVYMGSLLEKVEDIWSGKAAGGGVADLAKYVIPTVGTVGIVLWTKQFLSNAAGGSKSSSAATRSPASPPASPLASPRATRTTRSGRTPAKSPAPPHKTPAKAKAKTPRRGASPGRSASPARTRSRA